MQFTINVYMYSFYLIGGMIHGCLNSDETDSGPLFPLFEELFSRLIAQLYRE